MGNVAIRVYTYSRSKKLTHAKKISATSLLSCSHILASLGARSSKNQRGGSGKSAGVEVYTAPGMQAHF